MKLARILMPTDFSELSRRAAPVARALAQASGATVHVLHVAQPVEQWLELPEAGVLRRRVPPDARTLRARLADYGQDNLGDFGVPYETVLRDGRPAVAIARYAHEARADRIIIATHGDGLLRHLLHGSVSKSVLEHAGCPVVMVPPPDPEKARRRQRRWLSRMPATA